MSQDRGALTHLSYVHKGLQETAQRQLYEFDTRIQTHFDWLASFQATQETAVVPCTPSRAVTTEAPQITPLKGFAFKPSSDRPALALIDTNLVSHYETPGGKRSTRLAGRQMPAMPPAASLRNGSEAKEVRAEAENEGATQRDAPREKNKAVSKPKSTGLSKSAVIPNSTSNGDSSPEVGDVLQDVVVAEPTKKGKLRREFKRTIENKAKAFSATDALALTLEAETTTTPQPTEELEATVVVVYDGKMTGRPVSQINRTLVIPTIAPSDAPSAPEPVQSNAMDVQELMEPVVEVNELKEDIKETQEEIIETPKDSAMAVVEEPELELPNVPSQHDETIKAMANRRQARAKRGCRAKKSEAVPPIALPTEHMEPELPEIPKSSTKRDSSIDFGGLNDAINAAFSPRRPSSTSATQTQEATIDEEPVISLEKELTTRQRRGKGAKTTAIAVPEIDSSDASKPTRAKRSKATSATRATKGRSKMIEQEEVEEALQEDDKAVDEEEVVVPSTSEQHEPVHAHHEEIVLDMEITKNSADRKRSRELITGGNDEILQTSSEADLEPTIQLNVVMMPSPKRICTEELPIGESESLLKASSELLMEEGSSGSSRSSTHHMHNSSPSSTTMVDSPVSIQSRLSTPIAEDHLLPSAMQIDFAAQREEEARALREFERVEAEAYQSEEEVKDKESAKSEEPATVESREVEDETNAAAKEESQSPASLSSSSSSSISVDQEDLVSSSAMEVTAEEVEEQAPVAAAAEIPTSQLETLTADFSSSFSRAALLPKRNSEAPHVVEVPATTGPASRASMSVIQPSHSNLGTAGSRQGLSQSQGLGSKAGSRLNERIARIQQNKLDLEAKKRAELEAKQRLEKEKEKDREKTTSIRERLDSVKRKADMARTHPAPATLPNQRNITTMPKPSSIISPRIETESAQMDVTILSPSVSPRSVSATIVVTTAPETKMMQADPTPVDTYECSVPVTIVAQPPSAKKHAASNYKATFLGGKTIDKIESVIENLQHAPVTPEGSPRRSFGSDIQTPSPVQQKPFSNAPWPPTDIAELHTPPTSPIPTIAPPSLAETSAMKLKKATPRRFLPSLMGKDKTPAKTPSSAAAPPAAASSGKPSAKKGLFGSWNILGLFGGSSSSAKKETPSEPKFDDVAESPLFKPSASSSSSGSRFDTSAISRPDFSDSSLSSSSMKSARDNSWGSPLVAPAPRQAADSPLVVSSTTTIGSSSSATSSGILSASSASTPSLSDAILMPPPQSPVKSASAWVPHSQLLDQYKAGLRAVPDLESSEEELTFNSDDDGDLDDTQTTFEIVSGSGTGSPPRHTTTHTSPVRTPVQSDDEEEEEEDEKKKKKVDHKHVRTPPKAEQPPARTFFMSPEYQCVIETGNSSDEDDEEEESNNPLWTTKKHLIPALEAQYQVDPDEVFGTEFPGCDLAEIFTENKVRVMSRPRTSSAYWNRDRLTADEKREYKRRMGFTVQTLEKEQAR